MGQIKEVVLKDELTNFINSTINNNAHQEDAFYVIDLDFIASLVERWNRNLPNIRPFYAVKCNPDLKLLEAMVAHGVGFDVASQGEIKTLLSLGVSPDSIIYANPCKSKSHLKFAASAGVNLATFDTVYEVEKMRTTHPNCDLLVRIQAPEDGDAIFCVGSRYGAIPEEFETLLRAAQEANLNVIGASFHVGSAAKNLHAFRSAIAMVKQLFDVGLRLGMPQMTMLNIGGGFTAGPRFEESATVVKSAIEEFFSDVPNLEVIAEPGRYFPEKASTLVARVIGKRKRGGDLREYWIGDGVFGTFNSVFTEFKRVFEIVPLAWASNPANLMCRGVKTWRSSVLGPTCHCVDNVATNRELPDLEVDDWLVFPNMGAYDAAIRTNFNGFSMNDIPTYVLKSQSK